MGGVIVENTRLSVVSELLFFILLDILIFYKARVMDPRSGITRPTGA